MSVVRNPMPELVKVTDDVQFFVDAGRQMAARQQGVADLMIDAGILPPTEPIHEAQISARSQMYMNSAREAYERANMRASGVADLPAYPGDGSTICLCLTSPESKVLTIRGWVALLDIEVGEMVLTHRGRWRPVTALLVKPSAPYHRETILTGPNGRSVRATHNHLWYTTEGWKNSTALDNSSLLCYNTSKEVEHGDAS